MISITVIAMAILGGGDNARGPRLGVVSLCALSKLLWANAPLLYMIVLGIVLIVFVLLVPNGLIGLLSSARLRPSPAPREQP